MNRVIVISADSREEIQGKIDDFFSKNPKFKPVQSSVSIGAAYSNDDRVVVSIVVECK